MLSPEQTKSVTKGEIAWDTDRIMTESLHGAELVLPAPLRSTLYNLSEDN
jgi:hypothetical protein